MALLHNVTFLSLGEPHHHCVSLRRIVPLLSSRPDKSRCHFRLTAQHPCRHFRRAAPDHHFLICHQVSFVTFVAPYQVSYAIRARARSTRAKSRHHLRPTTLKSRHHFRFVSLSCAIICGSPYRIESSLSFRRATSRHHFRLVSANRTVICVAPHRILSSPSFHRLKLRDHFPFVSVNRSCLHAESRPHFPSPHQTRTAFCISPSPNRVVTFLSRHQVVPLL